MVSRYNPAAEPTIWQVPDDPGAACEPLLPAQKPHGTPGRPIVPFRRVLDGSHNVLRTSAVLLRPHRDTLAAPVSVLI